MVGEHVAAYNGDGDASRLAFEKLIEGAGWNEDTDTQMSKLKKMMENEDENEAANVIVSHLSQSPGHGLSSNLSTSSAAKWKQPGSWKDTSSESGLSIMARVLGRSSSNSKRSSADLPESKPSKYLTGTTAMPSSASDTAKSFASPTKRSTSGSLFRTGSISAAGAPETPERNAPPSDAFYSTNGTLLGLSPSLRSLGASALLKNDGIIGTTNLGTIIGTTNLTAPFSPGPSRSLLLKGSGGEGSMGANTNLTVPYSPAPSMLFRAFDEKTGDENRFAFDQDDARVCEDSNQLGDLAVGADLSGGAAGMAAAAAATAATNLQQPNGNSLIIAPDEFDAISGLGALSHSPFKTAKSASLSHRNGSDDGGDGGNGKKKKKKAKSFFARVVGDSKAKSPQKKLF